MPGQICAVASCKSNRLTLKKKNVHLIFHSFPKGCDLVSSTMRKEWINRCKRGDKFNPTTSRICSLHFTSNDYERDLQNELLGLPLRRVLKKTAVPTVSCKILRKENHLERPGKKSIIQDTPHAKRAGKKINKDLVQSLLAKTKSDNFPSTSIAGSSSDTDILDKPSILPIPTKDAYKEKYEDLLVKYNKLKSNTDKKMKGLK